MINKKYLKFKSLIDFVLAIILFIVFLPFTIAIALLILLIDRHKIIFVQKRVGMSNKFFNLYKFRTMYKNNGNNYYCKKGDPRITPLGLFLRKYSLDELPQLINIIKGEMSFIGPRPPVHDELENEDITLANQAILNNRFSVKPGISGMAQVYGRNSNDWNKKIPLDNNYAIQLHNNFIRCIRLDFLLVILTFKEIFFTSGEYDD